MDMSCPDYRYVQSCETSGFIALLGWDDDVDNSEISLYSTQIEESEYALETGHVGWTLRYFGIGLSPLQAIFSHFVWFRKCLSGHCRRISGSIGTTLRRGSQCRAATW